MSNRSAILILAHKNPLQLRRLYDALQHPRFDVYISIDANCDMTPFKEALPNAVFIRQRERGVWGGFSLVQASLNGVEEILSSEEHYHYVHFISGQDYPVLPMSDIARATDCGNDKQYITWHDISGNDHYHKNMRKRYEYYHINHRNRNLTIILNRLIKTFQPFKRRSPITPVYKGGGWWSLTGDCLHYILDYCREHPEVVRFFRKTHCADEIFFQTIIKNSTFGDCITGKDMRYVDWSAHGKSPETLTSGDFEKIINSGNWFARKFDTDKDSKILDLLDEYRKNKSQGI